ncbi:TMEM175 family protein [Plantactinospora sonchi]|uniref:TMEM175 family protein n=1 Tax=Plantactinospora sonchi TaxID=1544735 RepID=A0ABU7RV40_9ACTN
MTEAEGDPGRPGTLGRVSETDRLKAFSDGVFAIVITLLVLDLRLPPHEPGGLLRGLLHEWPAYLAFTLSFGYIGVIWLNHHSLLRLVSGVTRALNWINLAVLFGAVVLPFSTMVLASAMTRESNDFDHRVAVVLYALSAGLMSLPWMLLFEYLRHHPELLASGVTVEYVRSQVLRPLTGLILYSLSGILGWFVNPTLGLVLIIAMVIYHAFTSEGLRRGRSGHPRR